MSYQEIILRDNPIAHYPLNDNGASAVDIVGGNNGTYAGSVAFWQPGAIASGNDRAVAFDGATGRAEIPQVVATPAGGITVECFAKLAATQASRCFASNYSLGNAVGWALGISDGINNVCKWFVSGAGSFTLEGGILTPGVWYHVVGTADGVNAKLYINGEIAASQATSILPGYTGAVADIGCLAGGGLQHFYGDLDEVAIYSGALTQAKIRNHYAEAIAANGIKRPRGLSL